jgi:tol-pal system protein YbgF
MGQGRRFFIVFFFAVLNGCAARETTMMKEPDVTVQVESLTQVSAITNQQINGLTIELRDLQDQVRKDSATIRELRETVKELSESLNILLMKKSVVQDRGKPRTVGPDSRISTVTTAGSKDLIKAVQTSAVKRKDNGGAAYTKAIGLFKAGKYPEAIESFTAYLKEYPGSVYAANAHYWIGECHYSRAEYAGALDAFRMVIENYPAGNKVPDAMLKAGYAFRAMNQPDSATSILETLVQKYPESAAAAKARTKLNRH